MNLILIGPPGCGKGTQAERLVAKYNFQYISTGNLIREEIHDKTPLGKKVEDIIDSGHFVDDEVVLELVGKAIEGKKAILFDGFPRTLNQAKELDKLRPVDVVIDIQVADEVVIERIGHRWMVEINHEQHTFKSKADADDYVKQNGGEAFQRHDDTPKVIKERLSDYHKLTEPIIKHYGAQHKLFIINGEKSIENVWNDVQKIIVKQQ